MGGNVTGGNVTGGNVTDTAMAIMLQFIIQIGLTWALLGRNFYIWPVATGN